MTTPTKPAEESTREDAIDKAINYIDSLVMDFVSNFNEPEKLAPASDIPAEPGFETLYAESVELAGDFVSNFNEPEKPAPASDIPAEPGFETLYAESVELAGDDSVSSEPTEKPRSEKKSKPENPKKPTPTPDPGSQEGQGVEALYEHAESAELEGTDNLSDDSTLTDSADSEEDPYDEEQANGHKERQPTKNNKRVSVIISVLITQVLVIVLIVMISRWLKGGKFSSKSNEFQNETLPPSNEDTVVNGTQTGLIDGDDSEAGSLEDDTTPTLEKIDSYSRPPRMPSSFPADTSSLPSDMPSLFPSGTPSSLPSDTPTSLPSDTPSSLPSWKPSTAPTGTPSSVPTAMPSKVPSPAPTTSPILMTVKDPEENIDDRIPDAMIAPELIPEEDVSSLVQSDAYFLLSMYVSKDLLLDPTSPQGKALLTVYNSGLTDYGEIREMFALLTLYHATGGDDWNNNSGWSNSNDLCHWYGVGTPRVGVCTFCRKCRAEVQTLGLANNNLVGSIPDEICLLSNLKAVDLRGNSISNPLPRCLVGSSLIEVETDPGV